MRKPGLIALLICFTSTAMAGIALRDVLSGPEVSQIGLGKACREKILKIDRSKYVIPYIQDKIVSLDQVTNGRVFYHYTNANVLLDVLQAAEPNRKKAQQLIEESHGIQSIMMHSYDSWGDNIAGNGFYLAGNPFSSMSYGRIQTSFKISPKARTLQLNIDDFRAFIRELSLEVFLTECRPLLQTLVLQENGVDLFLYDNPVMWYVLVNEDVIEETNIIRAIDTKADVITMMSDAKRLDEIDVKLFKSERPIAREGKPFYSLDVAFSGACNQENNDCYRLILETLIKNCNYSYINPYLTKQYKRGYFFTEELSEIFNQELKKGNVESSEAIFKASCKAVDRDTRLYLVDVLIKEAPRKYRKELALKKEELCSK